MALFRFRFRRRSRDVVCRDAVELMTDYLEGALSDRDRARLEVHLSGCPHCSEYLAQLRDVIAAGRRVEPDELEPETVDALVGLYRRWRAD